MNTEMTVGEVKARLERRLTFHQQQAEMHAGQEAYHREERERHAGKVESLGRHLAAFCEAASPALDEASLSSAEETGARIDRIDLDDGGPRPPVQRRVDAVVSRFAPGEAFGVSKVIRELERLYGQSFPQNRVSNALRRLVDLRRIHLARRGRPHREALYVRGQAPSGG